MHKTTDETVTTASFAQTHVGRRDNNEDSFFASDELKLYAVADGMGGYEGGELASQLAIEAIREFLQRRITDPDETWPFGFDERLSAGQNLLASAVRLANERVLARKAGRYDRMGTTMVALALLEGELVIAHVGDSRVYRLRAAELTRLTRDHSLVAEMEAAGAIEDASESNLKNVITRALGMAGVEPELRRERPEPGDLYMLCSDGLLETVDDASIGEIMRSHNPEEACRILVEQAYERGGRDNITVVIVVLR